MAEKLTKKQEEFARNYLDTGNGTKAALQAYNTDSENTASSIASENLTKPKIIEFLQENAQECASIILNLARTAENETVRLNASRDVLDRAGLKPTDKIDHTTKGEAITGINYITPNGGDNTSTTS